MREFANLRMDTWWRERAAECLLAVALSPAFAWISPFTTNDQMFLARLGYWVAMLSCWFLMTAATGRVIETSGVLRQATPFIREITTVACASLLLIPIVAPATHALTGWLATVDEVIELYFQIAVLGFGVTLIGRSVLVCRFGGGQDSAQAFMHAPFIHQPPVIVAPITIEPVPEPEMPLEAQAVARVTPNRLIGRLPSHVRGAIVALEMEDHYVRVHTERGSALVLLRLSDAMAEVAPIAGRQVHRSWWVADEAIEHFERVGRAGQIRLSNGLNAPVSQRYLKEVEAFAK